MGAYQSLTDASREMIDDALACLADERYASAITLALAAEGMLPPLSNGLDLSKDLIRTVAEKTSASEKSVNDTAVNYTRNLLKHAIQDPDWSRITEGEAARAIGRALFRFVEIHDHDQRSDLMAAFANALNARHSADDVDFSNVCVEFRRTLRGPAAGSR